jgi:hypothetical protein
MKLGLGLGINRMRPRPRPEPEGAPLELRSAPAPEPEPEAMEPPPATPAQSEPPKRKGLIYRLWQRIKAGAKPCPFILPDKVRHLYQQIIINYGRGTKPGRRTKGRQTKRED